MMEYSEQAIMIVWGGSLIIGVVVIVVVALLLALIRNTAKKIDAAAGHIWTQGKLVANNTIHIPIFLATTNRVAGEILGAAGRILGSTRKVGTHINGCPGCPNCMLE